MPNPLRLAAVAVRDRGLPNAARSARDEDEFSACQALTAEDTREVAGGNPGRFRDLPQRCTASLGVAYRLDPTGACGSSRDGCLANSCQLLGIHMRIVPRRTDAITPV